MWGGGAFVVSYETCLSTILVEERIPVITEGGPIVNK